MPVVPYPPFLHGPFQDRPVRGVVEIVISIIDKTRKYQQSYKYERLTNPIAAVTPIEITPQTTTRRVDLKMFAPPT